MDIKLETVSQPDLEAINALTLREFAENEVVSFPAKLIDDSPTSNNRIWSVEWQQANVNQFVGVPVIVDHELAQANVLGRVYLAEQVGNEIRGKIYVALMTESGPETKRKIESRTYKSVSIGARANNTKREGKYTRILPGPDDRVFEVSFVAAGGCKDCEILKQECACNSAGEESKADTAETKRSQESVLDDPWLTEARAAHASAVAEYVRLAAFCHGPSIDKAAYKRVAESADPETLRSMSNDLQRLYDQRQGEKSDVTGAVARESVNSAIHKILTAKGV